MTSQDHLSDFLRLALDEAEKCETTPTAFCVGCVLVAHWPDETSKPVVVGTGYSRELPGNTHAEANALAKFRELNQSELQKLLASSGPPDIPLNTDEILKTVDVYTTMEPCSIRTSGLAPCADALIAARVRRCYIGVNEPDDFVNCEGARKLKETGIEVLWVKGFEEECLRVARRGHA